MLTPDDINLQRAIVEQVIAIRPRPGIKEALAGLNPLYASRIGVYHDSFLGRAVSSLAEVVLASVCADYGTELIKELVARYFANLPPSSLCIVRALDGLAGFIREKSEGESVGDLADAIEVSLARWHLLHGIDPPSQRRPGHLAGPAVFSAGVLMIKIKFDTIAVFNVPRSLHTIARLLTRGDSIEQVIKNLHDQDIADCDEEELAGFLRLIF
ncbi:MAG: hypothetical protein M3Q07_14785 [Pseudobdellovibrionaceae bacterium]|nr:hypothetical protein [Pseudobdellovibrionaceae bacterium]